MVAPVARRRTLIVLFVICRVYCYSFAMMFYVVFVFALEVVR
jgi:hypothetical protein